MARRYIGLMLLVCAIVSLASCAQSGHNTASTPNVHSSGTAPTTQRLPIVASFSILGDIVQHVGGDAVQVTTLVGPNGDAHTFEPSPADSARLAQAAVIFQIGAGFEPWLDQLATASETNAQRVTVSDGISFLTFNAESEARSEFDPHIWHDVTNVMTMTQRIRDGLIAADPAHTAIYMANADRYLVRLSELDAWVIAQVQSLPPERRRLVTSHDTFAYFARRYGFQIIGSGLASASTETSDPSAAQMVELVQRIRTAGVPVIFAENVHNPALMSRIAAEAGVTLGPPLYTDALDLPGTPGDSYEKMMRSNVQIIVDALKGF